MGREPAYRADGRDCDAAQFYGLACDPRRSGVIEACAGAGKTWMLVSRIVRALLDGAAPDEILAITFTRKAAAEMRVRLHEWLREFAEASPQQRIDALVARGLSRVEAARSEGALAGLHAQVLQADTQVQIHTFHAWFARLLQLAPLELLDALGLHPAMSLIEEIGDQVGELMRRFQREVLAQPVLLQDYRALIKRHGRWRLDQWLHAALDRRQEIERADAHGALAHAIEPAAQRWPGCAGFAHPILRATGDAALRRVLGRAVDALVAHGGGRERNAADELTAALDLADAAATLRALRKALLTKAGSPRVLAASQALDDACEALRLLERQMAQQDAHDDHQRMVRLSRVLLRCWQVHKRERALMDMQDLERGAWALLSDPVASGWVQQRLDVRLRHVLIDEFQDTSHLQWQALHSWLAAYAGAGGGTSGQQPPALFIVGDPKQSIYRFRGAEPRVFAAARRFVVEGLAGYDLLCNHTRRNASAVIGAVNAVFGGAQSAGDYAGFVAHSTQHDGGPVGEVRRVEEPPRAPREAVSRGDGWRDSLTVPRHEAREPRALDEARLVARGVRQLIVEGGVGAGQIMVLARRHAPLARVAQALQALHVPCVAAEEVRLGSLIEVQDLVAVLDVLASPAHDLSLAQALKSPLFGASDAQLLALSRRAAGEGGATPWWSALLTWPDAPPELARARGLLMRWAGDARVLPPHDLLDRVVDQGDLMARLAAAVPAERRVASLAAVQALLALSLAIDGGRHASIYRFVRALRQQALAVRVPARADAVQLSTVHGAKGLEAPCVWVVDADPHEPRESKPGLLIDWPVDSVAPRLAAFVADLSSPCVSLSTLRDDELAAAQREELNALYVAMTRAERMLVFSRTAPRRDGSQGGWWARAVPHAVVWSVDGAQAPGASPEATPAVVTELPAPSPRAPLGKTQQATTSSPAAQLGRAVHRVLQWSTAGQPAADLHTLAAAAATEFELPSAAIERVEHYARTIRESPALQRFFDPSQFGWSADEFDIVSLGDILRIDRLVRFDAPARSWWVLDYKLAADAAADAGLRRQLARYRDAVRVLAAGAPVHAAFITGDGALHELPPAERPGE